MSARAIRTCLVLRKSRKLSSNSLRFYAGWLRPPPGVRWKVVSGHTSRAPTVRLKEVERQWQREKALQNLVPFWPVDAIKHACRSGLLPCNALEAMVFLDTFALLKRRGRLKPAANVLRLQDHDLIQPRHVTVLAHILRQSNIDLLSPIADSLLKCAFELADPAAAIALVNEATKAGRKGHIDSPDILLARRQIEAMAGEGKQTAIMLHGRILWSNGVDVCQVLKLLEQAVEQTMPVYGTEASGERDGFSQSLRSFKDGLRLTGIPAFRRTKSEEPSVEVDVPEVASRGSMAEALHTIAQIQTKLERPDKARQAAETAVRHCGDPKAYYFLAQHHCDPSSREYFEYLMKAAQSGIPAAAYRMGLWILQELEREKPAKEGLFKRLLSQALDGRPLVFRGSPATWWPVARMWFDVAAVVGHEDRQMARMHIVRLMLREGDTDGGLRLLQELSRDPSIPTPKVKWLHRLWRSGEPDRLTSLEFEAQIRS